MELSSAIIEIPAEILQVNLKVQREDPLSEVFEIAKSSQSSESSSPSLLRLEALSRSSHSSVSGKGDFSTPIIRDLWRGEYWRMSEISYSLDAAKTGSVVPVESQVPRISEATAKDEVADIANPILGYLVRQSRVPRNQILSRTRLEGVSPKEEVVHLRARVVLRQDKAGRKYWVWDEGPLQKLIANHIQELPGFEIQETELTESIQSWPHSPEIKALKRFKKNRNEKQALEILDSIHDQINQDNRPRLNWTKQVVGFRQDMWDAVQEVVRSSKERVFILTSFSNPQFSDDVADLLAEATEDDIPEIMLSFGEPDRGRSPEDIQNTEQYISTLAKDKRFKLKGGISPRSSHAKVVISDTGMAFICSCNLFSGALESGILESGLLIKDIHCAKSIIESVNEEEWVPDEIEKDLEKMHSELGKMKRPNWTLRNVNKKITEIKKHIRNGNQEYAFLKLERLLRDIAEKPVWSLIRTLEHRPFMADCIERFDKRIVMASDGLRSNGLDKATIHRIDQRASKSGATVHVWWGRHAPKSKPFNEADKRGRKEAKDRLNQLRKLRNKEKKWNLLPYSSVEPMETHAKAFIVDDSRLMITSDNTLSFGDTESERGDAGELGIMIDHPRLAIQTRGSMELWFSKDARIPGDLTRWWAILGEEVSLHTHHSSEQMSLIGALDLMIERIESNEHLRVAWEQEVEKTSNWDELTIVNKLALGVKFGTYCIAKSHDAKGIKSKLSIEQLNDAVISLSTKSVWKDNVSTKNHQNVDFEPKLQALLDGHHKSSIDNMIDEALVIALIDYQSKSKRREHFVLRDDREYEFTPPNILRMKFKSGFVLNYLHENRDKIIPCLTDSLGFEVNPSWKKMKTSSSTAKRNFKRFVIDENQEITPEIWSNAFVHYMIDPSEFELVSYVLSRMTRDYEILAVGSGKTAKYIINQCSQYLEIERRDAPVRNSLLVRRRSE